MLLKCTSMIIKSLIIFSIFNKMFFFFVAVEKLSDQLCQLDSCPDHRLCVLLSVSSPHAGQRRSRKRRKFLEEDFWRFSSFKNILITEGALVQIHDSSYWRGHMQQTLRRRGRGKKKPPRGTFSSAERLWRRFDVLSKRQVHFPPLRGTSAVTVSEGSTSGLGLLLASVIIAVSCLFSKVRQQEEEVEPRRVEKNGEINVFFLSLSAVRSKK